MIERINNTIKTMKEWDIETLESIKYVCFVLIVADLFGLWWFLGWKSLAGAILIVLMVVLAIILYLMNQKGSKHEFGVFENQSEPQKPQNQGVGDMLGLPSSEEYQERMNKAFGVG